MGDSQEKYCSPSQHTVYLVIWAPSVRRRATKGWGWGVGGDQRVHSDVAGKLSAAGDELQEAQRQQHIVRQRPFRRAAALRLLQHLTRCRCQLLSRRAAFSGHVSEGKMTHDPDRIHL